MCQVIFNLLSIRSFHLALDLEFEGLWKLTSSGQSSQNLKKKMSHVKTPSSVKTWQKMLIVFAGCREGNPLQKAAPHPAFALDAIPVRPCHRLLCEVQRSFRVHRLGH